MIQLQYTILDKAQTYNTNKSNIFHSIVAAFDTGADWIWDNHNKGKLWKDIKHKYETEE